MFNELSKSLGIISGLVLAMIAVVFCAAFLIAQDQEQYTIQAPQNILPPTTAIALTEQQEIGKSIFKTNCAACHNRYKKAVGPALYGVTERHSLEWLYEWIYDPAAMIKSGDQEAVAIYNEYNQANMNAFPQLSKQDVDAILSWVEISK